MKRLGNPKGEIGLDELIVSWKDFGIRNSVVLGSKEYIHNLNKNIIYLSENQELNERNAVIYGDGTIEYNEKKIKLKKEEIAVIDKTISIYSEEIFVKKFL